MHKSIIMVPIAITLGTCLLPALALSQECEPLTGAELLADIERWRAESPAHTHSECTTDGKGGTSCIEWDDRGVYLPPPCSKNAGAPGGTASGPASEKPDAASTRKGFEANRSGGKRCLSQHRTALVAAAKTKGLRLSAGDFEHAYRAIDAATSISNDDWNAFIDKLPVTEDEKQRTKAKDGFATSKGEIFIKSIGTKQLLEHEAIHVVLASAGGLLDDTTEDRLVDEFTRDHPCISGG